ncbi:MAG: AI-2E family transporter [Lachnospiraceae bacterium]
MKWKIEKKYIKGAVSLLVVIIIAMLFQHSLTHEFKESETLVLLESTFRPIIGGCIFAYLLNPILFFYEHYFFMPLGKMFWKSEDKDKARKNFSRAWGIVLTMITFFIIVIGGLYLVVPQVYQSLVSIVSDAPNYYNSVVKWIDSLEPDKSELSKYILMVLDRAYDQGIEYLNNKIIPNMDKIVVGITSGIVGGLKILLQIILMIIISVYVLAEKELLISVVKKLVFSIFSRKHANNLLCGARYAHKVFGGFISGKIIDSFIIGAFCYLFMTIAGMEYSVLISIIVGITNIIPYFGPFIGAIPSALILLIVDWHQGIFFIIFILILQQIDGNIIGPLILGDRLNLSSMWILFSIMIGGGLFGVPGMVLGAPCFACIYALVGALCNLKLEKKELPTDTKQYLQIEHISSDGVVHEIKPDTDKRDDIHFFRKNNKDMDTDINSGINTDINQEESLDDMKEDDKQ